MFNLGYSFKNLLKRQWRGELSEYVTAVTWSADGLLAASSAAGEVLLWDAQTQQETPILSSADTEEQSIDCLAFSPDGQFLAAGGQDGKVRLWRLTSNPKFLQPIATLNNAPKWIDRLAWNPTCNHLGFSLGRYVQVWDAEAGEIVATLPFASSSVL